MLFCTTAVLTEDSRNDSLHLGTCAKSLSAGDANHSIVELEMKEVVESLQESELLSYKNFFDIRDLIKTRPKRYRTMINFSFSWFGQFSGNNVIRHEHKIS